MSISRIGKPKTIGMTGKAHSHETKQKMRDKVINSPSYQQRCQQLKNVNDKRFFESRCIKLNALIDSVFA
jgi:biotin synthase-like enzyme